MHTDSIPRDDQTRLNAVIQFADNVLKNGRDRSQENPTPLFADGINVVTGEHLQWVLPDGSTPVVSDLAAQQNLFRTMSALSVLTGDERYKNAAREAVRFHFDHLVDSSGLLFWGGHRFIDLKTGKPSGFDDKSLLHELKNCFPYYELMYEVNPQATSRFIKAFWNAHVYDWDNLFIGRHGKYGLEPGEVWDHPLVQPAVLRESSGLSFINAGSDLIYAAAVEYKFSGNVHALEWARHLARQYVLARDPKTGLGSYLFTRPKKIAHTDDDSITLSCYGDRAGRQFGPELGEAALEAYLLLPERAEWIYCGNAVMQFWMARELGLADVLEWTKSGLVRYAHYAYDPEKNMVRPLLADGTDLTGFILKRDGYFGKAGKMLARQPVGTRFFLSYTRGYVCTKDRELWRMARNIAAGLGLGDLGTVPGQDIKINADTGIAEARPLFALIDLYHETASGEYLDLARRVGDNILKKCFNNGYFTIGIEYLYSQFSSLEPFALLALQAALDNRSDRIPYFIDGQGYIGGNYKFPDGSVRQMKDHVLFRFKKGQEIE